VDTTPNAAHVSKGQKAFCMTMKPYMLFAFSMFMLLACSEDETDEKDSRAQWKKLGLDGTVTNQMQLSGDNLYVATTTGLFKKDIDTNSDFVSLGFADKNVQALEIVSAEHLFVSVVDKSGVEPPRIYQSDDDGETWSEVGSNFGGENPEPVFDFAYDEINDILYASGYSVVAKSADDGITWEPIYGFWQGFATGVSVVAINPNDRADIWAGGQGGMENGFLARSSTGAWDTWHDLVENPTVVKEITFTPGNRDRIFVGFEGALLKTDDGGETWQTLIDSEQHKFYFGICLNNASPDRIYTGGWIKTPDPQPLVLHMSTTGGSSWTDIEYPDEEYGGIWDMVIKSEASGDRLFLGLNKGGVYEVVVR